MKNHCARNVCAALPALLLATSCGLSDAQLADVRALVNGNTVFAVELYSRLRQQDGNLFFSPYSISTALAMTCGGARGDTKTEMAGTLHFTLGVEKTHAAFAGLDAALGKIHGCRNTQLLVANSLWPQKDRCLLPEYVALVKRHYGVSMTPVDYAKATDEARKTINTWVEDQTREKIKDIIGPGYLDSMTRLVLVNAIYFKGNWENRFDPANTRETDYTLPSGEKILVPMMRQEKKFGYKAIPGAQLLEMPYADRRLSMIVILPAEPDGLSAVEETLTADNFDSWLSDMPEQQVAVFLPRFKIEWGAFDLKQPLQEMGMRNAFGSEADFSGMDGSKGLFIGFVMHKAFIEVNEEGTEAAAATAVGLKECVMKTTTFRADHPFLFLIRDNETGSILFIGRMLDPRTRIR